MRKAGRLSFYCITIFPLLHLHSLRSVQNNNNLVQLAPLKKKKRAEVVASPLLR